MTALSCSLAYRADGAEAHFPPGTLIPTLCIIEGLPAAMYTISLPYLCFFAAITAGEAAGSECANSTRKGLLQSGPNKSAGAKGRIEPFVPALICIRGCSAVYPPEQPSGAALPTKTLAQAASPHCNHEEKRRVSNGLTRLFSKRYFAALPFCFMRLDSPAKAAQELLHRAAEQIPLKPVQTEQPHAGTVQSHKHA